MAKGKYIENTNDGEIILGSTSKDTIENYGVNVFVSTGGGNDSIYNSAGTDDLAGVTIDAGKGNDTIDSEDDYVSLNGGVGKDFIKSNGGDYVTLVGGKGKDTLVGEEGSAEIYQYAKGDGNDVIFGFNEDDTFHITEGKLKIKGSKVKDDDFILKVGSGKITLKGAATTPITILDADGYTTVINDGSTSFVGQSIGNSNDYTLVSGTDYEDTILNSGYAVTVDGGDGADKIYLFGDRQVINYAAGGGRDTVYSFDSDDTLNITSGTYTTTKSGDDVIINVGSGSIRLIDVDDDPIKVINAAGVLSTINVVEIIETVAPDTIGQTISNYSDDTLIIGTDYDDTIINRGEDVTIVGGDGNDLIRLSGDEQLIYYANGDGNDTVYDFDSDDTLNITSGTYTTLKSGDDVIINVGSGSIRLIDVDDEPIKVINAAGVLSTINVVEIIETVAPDTIGQTISNYSDDTLIIGTDYDDTIINRGEDVTIVGGDGNDIIDNYEEDASINGGAGNDDIYNSSDGEEVTINGGLGNDTLYLTGDRQVVNYAAGDGNDVVYNFGSTDTLNITSGTYTTTKSGNDLIVNVGSGSITLKNLGIRYVSIRNQYGTMSTVDAGSVTSGSSGDGSIDNTVSGVVVSGTNDDDYINNIGSYVSINGGTGADEIRNYGQSSDINGNAGNDTIRNGSIFSYSTVAAHSTIHGGDGSDYINNWSSHVLINGDDDDDSIFGYGNYSTLLGGDDDDELYGVADHLWIDGGEDEDVVSGIGSYSTLSGGGDDDTLFSTGDYNVLNGGDGNDTILSGTDTVDSYYTTITGGRGNDSIFIGDSFYNLIRYESGDGNDQIYGFGAGDTLHITSGSVSSTMNSGSSLIVSIGSGSIQLMNVAGSYINVKFGNEDTQSYYVSYSNQLPSDDYWFEPSSGGSNELDELIRNDYSADETAIGDLLDSLPSFDRATREVSTLAFDRHRSKK